jgi:hypothetical protein
VTSAASATPPPARSERDVLGEYVRRFRNRNGRNPASGRIHAMITREDWLGAMPLAVTACGSGIGGATGRVLVPTLHEVTCVRCLNLPAARAAAAHVPSGRQLSLV